ncbi:MAG: 16S rRNA (cytidine(1402)-2'-O)-methyltransferase [Firmicutes bacterium HGW-Firmicutes-14]|nr:MAG: 16S rRNA (cytidine(1402)-2'-O)-methyltransferase [Firmicutes bacterium HGW-Firmicutes-14]
MTSDGKSGTLYLCATPIGNLEDITLRALRILKEADLIAAEDTRHTRKLLSFYDIKTRLTSYHEHNKKEKGRKLIGELKEGKDIVLVSDAGTPGISDPGEDLVALAVSEGIRVEPVPGPSAVIAALSTSGLSTKRFVFEGFLPRAGKERKRILEQLALEERTTILYESPYRVIKTLEEISKLTGDREIVAAREITKIHEELIRGPITSIIEHFRSHPPKGEFTLVVKGSTENKKEPPARSSTEIRELVNKLVHGGWEKKEAIKEVARTIGASKKEVYNAVLEAEQKKERLF